MQTFNNGRAVQYGAQPRRWDVCQPPRRWAGLGLIFIKDDGEEGYSEETNEAASDEFVDGCEFRELDEFVNDGGEGQGGDSEAGGDFKDDEEDGVMRRWTIQNKIVQRTKGQRVIHLSM